jgi:hypothetical protein
LQNIPLFAHPFSDSMDGNGLINFLITKDSKEKSLERKNVKENFREEMKCQDLSICGIK